MTNWQTKKLGDIAKIQAGYGFHKNIQGKTSGDFPFIKVGDMNYQKQEIYLGISENYLDQNDLKENGYKTIPAGTIIFPKIGGAIATNKKRILAVDSLYDNNVMGIIPADVVLSEYLYYWLNTKNLSDWASGTSLPAINKSTIEAEELPLPPLATQHKIVAILDEKFAKLREAKRLRQETIVDTEKILAATLREIFEEGKENGWEEKSLEQVAPIRRENNKKLLPYVGMEDVESNTGKFLGSLDPKKVQSNTFYFDDTCVLYGRLRPYLNKVLVPDFEGHCSTEMFPLVPKKDVLLKQYLFYWITQQSFITDAMRTAGGARMPRANMKEVIKFKILVPPLTEQQKIVTRLDALSEKLRTLRELQQSQLEDMKKLEKAYLREAFRGELI